MAQYDIRIDTRRLERLAYVIVIILLFTMLIRPGFRNNTLKYFDSKEAITGAVTGTEPSKETAQVVEKPVQKTSPKIGPELKMPSQTQPVAQIKIKPGCTDRIQNQDETNVDCGGACGGYWYDNKCNKLRPAKKECEADEDCKEGYLCQNEKCVKSPYSGNITMQISNIKFTTIEKEDEDPLGQLASFDVYIKNDRGQAIRSPRLEIYIWDNLSADSYEFDIRQASIVLPEITGVFQQTISSEDPYYLVALPFKNINVTKNLRAELYDYKNNNTVNYSTTFI